MFVGSGIVAILIGVVPAHTRAQAIHYRSIPIGERAIGLGGSFTGVANDPSATYYNPAGLVLGGRFGLLGSFSSLVLTKKKITNAFEAPVAEETFSSSSTTSLPRFVGTVVRLGPKKFGNDHQFSLGYSTVEVSRNDLNIGVSQNNSTATLDLRINNNYNDRWYGVSFAAQASERSSVGFTIFLSDQSLGYQENIGLATGGAFDEQAGLRVGGESSTASGSVGASAYYFVPRLGWLHRINPKWTVGVMFQTPGIPLKQKGNALRRITDDRSNAESLFLFFDESDLKANLPIPFELRSGFGFQVTDDTLISVDASVTGPVRDKSVVELPDQFVTAANQLGIYIAASTKRRWTPNASIGVEHTFGKAVVAGGLFTNISAAPNVPATSDTYTPDQINLWGASVSVGLDTNGYRLTLGATGMYGKGDALGAILDEDENVISYQRTEARGGALFLYIAGAISVAAKTASRVEEKHKTKKREKASEQSGAAADTGTNADADTDAGSEAHTNADTDSGTDADAGSGAGSGTGTDAGIDAVTDTATGADAAR